MADASAQWSARLLLSILLKLTHLTNLSARTIVLQLSFSLKGYQVQHLQHQVKIIHHWRFKTYKYMTSSLSKAHNNFYLSWIDLCKWKIGQQLKSKDNTVCLMHFLKWKNKKMMDWIEEIRTDHLAISQVKAIPQASCFNNWCRMKRSNKSLAAFTF